MRRLVSGCSSESHPLYGTLTTFMARLSTWICEWDADDFHLLMTAKKNELINASVFEPSDSTVKNSISKDELAKHCRRRTQGAERTTELIEALLLSLSSNE